MVYNYTNIQLSMFNAVREVILINIFLALKIMRWI